VMVIPIADRHNAAAQAVAEQARAGGLRVAVDDSSERMNAKIRNAQLEKIPYMLVIGDREAEAGLVNVRLRTGAQRGTVPVADFVAAAQAAVAQKALI